MVWAGRCSRPRKAHMVHTPFTSCNSYRRRSQRRRIVAKMWMKAQEVRQSVPEVDAPSRLIPVGKAASQFHFRSHFRQWGGARVQTRCLQGSSMSSQRSLILAGIRGVVIRCNGPLVLHAAQPFLAQSRVLHVALATRFRFRGPAETETARQPSSSSHPRGSLRNQQRLEARTAIRSRRRSLAQYLYATTGRCKTRGQLQAALRGCAAGLLTA